MESSKLSRYKTPLLVVSVLILIWGVFGVLDIPNQTYRGYSTDGNNTVTRVATGSPAERAGFEVGDYIRRIDGASVEDIRAGGQRGRADINEVRIFEVERDGQALSLELTFEALPTNTALVNYGAIGIGILFLVFGVWAFLAAPSGATGLLAALGIALSPALTVGPYFTSAGARIAVGVVLLLLILVGFAVMTHFILIFPKKEKRLERRSTVWLVYGPAVVVGLLAGWIVVAQPTATSTINIFLRVLFGLFLVGYFGTSLVALIRSYVRASARERTTSGLNMLLAGAVVGLGPSLVISIVGLVAPRAVVPGAQFLPLLVGILPVMFAISAVRVERAKTAG